MAFKDYLKMKQFLIGKNSNFYSKNQFVVGLAWFFNAKLLFQLYPEKNFKNSQFFKKKLAVEAGFGAQSTYSSLENLFRQFLCLICQRKSFLRKFFEEIVQNGIFRAFWSILHLLFENSTAGRPQIDPNQPFYGKFSKNQSLL